LEQKASKLIKRIDEIKKEILFLKEKFKMLENLSDIRAAIKLIEKEVFKK